MPNADEAGERHHLLDGEMRGVHRREVVVEAVSVDTRRARRPLRPGWIASGTSASARYDHSGSSRRVVHRGGAGSNCSGRRHAPRKPSCLDAAPRLGERVVGSIIGSVATPTRRSGSCAAVLGEPLVDRPAQRGGGFAIGDALDHEAVGREQHRRARCPRDRGRRDASGRVACAARHHRRVGALRRSGPGAAERLDLGHRCGS